MRLRSCLQLVTLAIAISSWTATAEAIPLLQLDMAGGTYDPVTQSIVAPGGPFTLFAVLTPQNNTSASRLTALLNETYYVSVAITPQVRTETPLGSFTFGQAGSTPTTISATSDMTYGTPPIEYLESMQGHDGGDLPQHGTYPTYFAEFEFRFSSGNRTLAYNSQDDPGGLTPSSSGGAYYAAFTGNTSLLQAGYNLHFDLYDTLVRNCARNGTCGDVDVDRFAPFSHDAQTYTPPPPPPPPPPAGVPEPATALLMLAGVAAFALDRARRS